PNPARPSRPAAPARPALLARPANDVLQVDHTGAEPINSILSRARARPQALRTVSFHESRRVRVFEAVEPRRGLRPSRGRRRRARDRGRADAGPADGDAARPADAAG